MKIMRVINDELIDLKEFKKPNLVFNTNEYSNSEDLCIFHEQINPFDLYYENQEKDKEIERLNNIINTFEEDLENVKMNLRYSGIKWDKDCLIRAEVIKQVLDKLKELKESDNNE